MIAASLLHALPLTTFPQTLLGLDPGSSVLLLLTIGVLLLYAECLLPGRVLPGAVGLLFTLTSLHRLSSMPLNRSGIVLALAGILTLAAGILVPLRWPVTACSAAVLAFGAGTLFATDSAHPFSAFAFSLGVILGATSCALLQIAVRARRNKYSLRRRHDRIAWQTHSPE